MLIKLSKTDDKDIRVSKDKIRADLKRSSGLNKLKPKNKEEGSSS